MSKITPVESPSNDLTARQRSDQLAPTHQFDALWDAMSDLRRRVDDMFGSLTSDLGLANGIADVEETDDAYLVELDLAGVKREDVEVTASGRRLTVSGTRKEKERVGFLRRRNRTVGAFHHEVLLPGDVVIDDVRADLADGVLTVKLPKPESERTRHIRIS